MLEYLEKSGAAGGRSFKPVSRSELFPIGVRKSSRSIWPDSRSCRFFGQVLGVFVTKRSKQMRPQSEAFRDLDECGANHLAVFCGDLGSHASDSLPSARLTRGFDNSVTYHASTLSDVTGALRFSLCTGQGRAALMERVAVRLRRLGVPVR